MGAAQRQAEIFEEFDGILDGNTVRIAARLNADITHLGEFGQSSSVVLVKMVP
jgi:hypothetical protein